MRHLCWFLADHTLVAVELLSWLSSVCPSVRLSVTDVLWLNGARYGSGCYWSLIGSRILAFKWRINRWPWMTLKGLNALWNRIFQDVSAHISETVRDMA